MISVQEALAILAGNTPSPRVEHLGLDQAYGCYLSEAITAPEASPRYTSSAMDGFAVRWSDCLAARPDNPVHLMIIGESQAGVPFDGELAGGTAVRISTGAMLPSGADTVVRIEDCRENRETVDILAVDSLGKDVRQAGEEFCSGDLLFPAGTRLGPRELALLASVGRSSVPVFETPQVSLLITGTELARPDRIIRSI